MTLNERTLSSVRTRADQVRARRARLERVIERPSRERKVKPGRKARPRRRYDLAIPVERGAEVRLPSLPTVRVGTRPLTALLLSVMLWWMGQVLSSPTFHVEQPIVRGNTLLSPAQVRSIAQLDDMLVFLIDTQDVVDRLEKFPEVSSAQVQVGWPNEVEIQIEERKPIVEWDDAGRVWWLSSDGVAFIPHGLRSGMVKVETEEPTLQISDEPLKPVITPELLQAASEMYAQMPEVGWFTYDRIHGLGFDDARGWVGYFGTQGDMPLKVRIYRALTEQLSEKMAQATLVSVENASAPYFRVER
jgi:hypothetical protein